MKDSREGAKAQSPGGPKARTHTSLGQRPRWTSQTGKRAESPPQLRAAVAVWAGLSALGSIGYYVFLGRCPRLAWVAPLAHGEAQQRDFLTHLHQTLNAPSHPIRNCLLRLTAASPDLLAVIKQEGRV